MIEEQKMELQKWGAKIDKARAEQAKFLSSFDTRSQKLCEDKID
jgi:hypothetical protein